MESRRILRPFFISGRRFRTAEFDHIKEYGQMEEDKQQSEGQSVDETTELKNTVTIEDIGPCKKKVSVEVPAEKIKKITDEQYSELGREAVVPGFRKGRAPRRLLEKRFGKEASEQIKLKILADAPLSVQNSRLPMSRSTKK
jgi:FKBP-type peptidyl-prolyl cis-trans isomerase (trigger factor)